jgi:hemerythrin-like domain-containing protein
MTKTQDIVTRIKDEHVELRSALRDIRGELERLLAERGPEHRVGKLGAMLRMFGAGLVHHFELEERGGLGESAEGLDPGSQRALAKLLEQHRDFERRVARLLDSVQQVERGRACLPDGFVRELQDFLAELLEHESAENELFQRLVLQDIGGGD